MSARRGTADGSAGKSRAAKTVRVELGERSYPIRIGSGTLAEAGPAIERATKSKHAVIITVPGVGRRYGRPLERSLNAAGMRVDRITVPDGDATKNLDQMKRLYDELARLGVDRSAVLVALGGGMVGDLAGFAAATWLRGIRFVQVPTTLLAMVDSSIGGKVGVNLRQGKNLVGAFHQPRLVWIDIDVLQSLSRRQLACGFAEAYKKAAIWDARFFARIERDAERLLDLESERLISVIERAVRIKAEVVRRDEREGGLRMLLNFGHTLGHAVEVLTGYEQVLHGEAVAMGMVAAAERSERLGYAPPGTAPRLRALTLRFGLPVELPAYPRSAYISALRVDKKLQDARIQYVVLRGIGSATTIGLTPAEIAPSEHRGGNSRATEKLAARRKP